jgi:flagellar hook-length control protein FliK
MALNPTSTPTHGPAASSAASALAATRAKSRRAADDDTDDGGFAAELQRAQPPSSKSAGADASDAADKPAQAPASKTGHDDDAPAAAPQAGAAPAPAAPAQPADTGALGWAQQQLAASQAAQGDAAAGKLDPIGDAADLAKGIAALRKGASAAKGLAGTAGAVQDAKTAAAAKSSAEDVAAQGLGTGQGAANSATGTRDGLAALLPQADAAVPVQAGAVGANPAALLDAGASAQPATPATAQATLAMPPQSPAFAPALGQQIEVWMRDGIQHAEVQLNPLELGPIRVRIAVEGAATRVEMHADVASTRDALQQALPQLSDSLGQVGLSLAGGGVSDQSTAQSQAQAAFADVGQGASGRAGATRSRLDGTTGTDAAAAITPRQAPQRRGLLDLYA